MGWVVLHALNCTPLERDSSTKGEIIWIRNLCADLVQLARRRDGHPIVRATTSVKITAFEKVIEIMSEYGAPVTVSQLERWNSEYKK